MRAANHTELPHGGVEHRVGERFVVPLARGQVKVNGVLRHRTAAGGKGGKGSKGSDGHQDEHGSPRVSSGSHGGETRRRKGGWRSRCTMHNVQRRAVQGEGVQGYVSGVGGGWGRRGERGEGEGWGRVTCFSRGGDAKAIL